MEQQTDVIIIGAGITGLTIAHYLRKNNKSVIVLEKEPQSGGTMQTVLQGGWLIEQGPNSALETTPLFKELFEDLKISDNVVYANKYSDNRYIMRGGELFALPMSLGAFLKTKLWTLSGKFRLFKEPFVGRASKEESIADFVRRRLGAEFLDYAINPFVAGVFAGDPEQLSVRAAFPKLYALEEKYGGLIRGMILGARDRKKRAEKSKDRARQFSFLEGMRALPNAISQSFKGQIVFNVDVRSVTKIQETGTVKFNVSTVVGGKALEYSAGSVVFAIPSYAVSRYIVGVDSNLANVLETIYYPPVAEVYLGYKQDQIGRHLDGFGYLIPEKEHREILGSIWSSTIFASRAPAGFEAFTSFIGGSRQPEYASRPKEELIAITRREVESVMRIAGEPAVSFVRYWERAIPQYQLGHLDIIKRIEDFETRYPGLILAGNYRGGISVGDCVMSAHTIAERLISGRSHTEGGRT